LWDSQPERGAQLEAADTHGAEGAAFASSLRGRLFDLEDDHFNLLHYACTWHTHGMLAEDPTIGACWDADRLDLERFKIRIEPRYMTTEPGREIAANRSIGTFAGPK